RVKAGAGLPTSVFTSIATLDPPSGPGSPPEPVAPWPAVDGRSTSQAPAITATATITLAINAGDHAPRRGGVTVRRVERCRALIVQPQDSTKAFASATAGSAAPGTAGARVTT